MTKIDMSALIVNQLSRSSSSHVMSVKIKQGIHMLDFLIHVSQSSSAFDFSHVYILITTYPHTLLRLFPEYTIEFFLVHISVHEFFLCKQESFGCKVAYSCLRVYSWYFLNNVLYLPFCIFDFYFTVASTIFIFA